MSARPTTPSYGQVEGVLWPCESNGDATRAWVEREDFPESIRGTFLPPRFASDDDAAWHVAQLTGWPLRYAPLGDGGNLHPYVQPFMDDEWWGDASYGEQP